MDLGSTRRPTHAPEPPPGATIDCPRKTGATVPLLPSARMQATGTAPPDRR